MRAFTGRSECHFFDAASPIVEGESIDLAVAFRASRYDKGDADYINCPMDRAQYLAFRQALLEAEKAELKDFEQESANFFEGCLPIEELARRGEDTMRYGPLKPIGLWDPRWGDLYDRDVRRARRAHAVVQLRQEDRDGRLWNLVGFQTNLKWGEQKRVLRMIPGLENAEFVRFGVMHRNTFLEAPPAAGSHPAVPPSPHPAGRRPDHRHRGLRRRRGRGLAGRHQRRPPGPGPDPLSLPPTTMAGALLHFIATAPAAPADGRKKGRFQPMPPSFGLIPELPERIRDKRRRYGAYRDRALEDLASFAPWLTCPAGRDRLRDEAAGRRGLSVSVPSRHAERLRDGSAGAGAFENVRQVESYRLEGRLVPGTSMCSGCASSAISTTSTTPSLPSTASGTMP